MELFDDPGEHEPEDGIARVRANSGASEAPQVASRLQARPLASGPVAQAMRPTSGLAPLDSGPRRERGTRPNQP
jgi:hypothetical protein